MKLVRLFVNTHMGLGHDGLKFLMEKNGVSAPSYGEHVVFINRARDRVKMFSANNIIHYLRLEKGERLRMETIQFFPHVLGGGKINYPKALALSLGVFMNASQKKSKDVTVLAH